MDSQVTWARSTQDSHLVVSPGLADPDSGALQPTLQSETECWCFALTSMWLGLGDHGGTRLGPGDFRGLAGWLEVRSTHTPHPGVSPGLADPDTVALQPTVQYKTKSLRSRAKTLLEDRYASGLWGQDTCQQGPMHSSVDQLDGPRPDLPMLHMVWTLLTQDPPALVLCSSQCSPSAQVR